MAKQSNPRAKGAPKGGASRSAPGTRPQPPAKAPARTTGEVARAKAAGQAAARAKSSEPEKAKKKRRIRTATFRAMTKVGFVRRFYVRRTLRYMEKSRAKGRALPPELAKVDQMISKMPPKKRAEVLEAAMIADPDETTNRQLRRAAGRQDRLRGSGNGNRPGAARPPKGSTPRPR